ncbi:MAG: ABC transporter permease subunit [Bradyrhizobium sp.]|nr:ABC transporter permease subunit [Bradyrhizobium sp.]
MPPGMVPIALYFALMLLAPLGLLIAYSFWKASFFAVTPTFTLQNYQRVLTSSLYSQILLKTLGCSFIVACVAVVIGYAISYAISFRFKIWGPRLLVLIMASLLSSYIVRLYALTTILGTNGLLNQTLLGIGLIDQPLGFLLYGYFAIVIALVYVYLPFAVLPMYAGLQGIARHLLEASRDLGSGPVQTFLRVTLPLSMRGIRTAFALCFILAAADYVVPRLVGGMNGQMIGAIIADQFGGASNYPLGAALSVSMVIGFAVVLGAAFGVERLATRLWRAKPRHASGSGRRQGGIDWPNIPLSETITLLALVFLFAPLLTVVFFSFNAARNPGLPFTGFTLHWYGDVVQSPDFLRVLGTSLTVCVSAVAGGLLIGLPGALALARSRFALKGFFALLVYGPMAVPGVVIGVALLATFVFTGIRLGVLGTAAAHILLVTPFIVIVIRTRLEKMDRRIEEAARDLGSSPARVFRTVTLPILAPSLLGAGILAAAISLDELLVTNFTIGSQATVPVWISSQMRIGLSPSLNAVAVLMLSGSLGLIALAAIAIRLRRTMRLSSALAEAA